jgi:hypothetical protein
MHELIGCMCVVTVKPEGDRRGIIERIESLHLAKDFAESFERSQFKVQLTSSDIVVVSGSAISEIESTTAGSHSIPGRKKRGVKARTLKLLGETRKSTTTAAQVATKVRTRKARPRKNKNGG